MTDMKFLFASATSFDQNLANWDVSNVTEMRKMFDNATLSTSNYDSLLIGWNAQVLQPGVIFDGGNSQYCFAISERFAMMNDDSWVITDGDQDTSCTNCSLLVLSKEDNVGGTLRAAIGCAAAGDTILFANYLNGDTILLSLNVLMIDKEVSILVLDTFDLWIERESEGLIFNISPTGNLLLEGLEVIGVPNLAEPLILNTGNLSLKNISIHSSGDSSSMPVLDNRANLTIMGMSKINQQE
ncbi:MAG: hypothetical protein DRI69_09355 [Bacteroidetes bacterium]|nr:MAG: hypothetical protein DRI69_09355 [Bacteroidota bacterium]